jgi:hypothetical protein
MKDFLRVLKGLTLVIDQLALKNRSNIGYHLFRAQIHITELIKIFNEFKLENDINNINDKNSTPKNHDNLKNNTTDNEASNRTTERSNIVNDESFSTVINKEKEDIRINATSIESVRNHPLVITDENAVIEEHTEHCYDMQNTIEKEKIDNVAVNIETELMEEVTSTEKANDFNKPNGQYQDKMNQSNQSQTAAQSTQSVMRERAVPSTQMSRFFGFGSLALRMAMGAAANTASNIISGNSANSTISDGNAERLAEALCRMRGAALKLGQMLSLQDDSTLPPALAKALDRVKQAADYMPKKQLETQLVSQLGDNWRSKLLEFDYIPIAAASIGQVHKAKLLDGSVVAMKIQYPGVADSIESDLNNLKLVVNMSNIMPPGLFIDQIIKVANTELTAEC